MGGLLALPFGMKIRGLAVIRSSSIFPVRVSKDGWVTRPTFFWYDDGGLWAGFSVAWVVIDQGGLSPTLWPKITHIHNHSVSNDTFSMEDQQVHYPE